MDNIDWGALFKSDELTQGEKDFLFDHEYGYGGSFSKQLYETILLADEENMARLALGFPAQVLGVRAWKYGNLAQRLEQFKKKEK